MTGERRAIQRVPYPVAFLERVEFQKGIESDDQVLIYEDFLLTAGGTLPAPWAKQDTSAAGSPTMDYVAGAAGGQYQITHDAQSELQKLTIYFGDYIPIDPTKKPIVEMRLKINFAGATFSADQRIVFGLASARNATLDSVVTNAWFRVEGANLNLLVEGDDGTTDTDDQDTTFDIVDNTFHTYRIDLSDLSNVIFSADLEDGNGWNLCPTPIAIAAATGNLQPFIEIQRDAGTEAEDVRIDYVRVTVQR